MDVLPRSFGKVPSQTSIRHGVYHRMLRSSAVLVAVMAFTTSGVVVPGTSFFADSTARYLANAVGMSASIEPNEINTLASELRKRGDELDSRERLIDARARDTGAVAGNTTLLLSSILALQLILIGMNYVLDYRRNRRVPARSLLAQ